jgi:thiol-disulfide isomerase/thioredoxin
MKEKSMKKVVSTLVAVLLALGLMMAAIVPLSAETDAETEENGTFYVTPPSNPTNWDPHTWVNVPDMFMLEFVVTPFVGNYVNADGERVFVMQAATAVTDITADFDYLEQWGIDPEAEAGFVWQIDLNPEMRWCDGTEITAHDYVWAMRRLFEPGTTIFRAPRYSVGAESIRNAYLYRNNHQVGETRFAFSRDVEITEDTVLVVNPDRPSVFFSAGMYAQFNTGFRPVFFIDDEDSEYDNMIDMFRGENGYIVVTDEVIELLSQVARAYRAHGEDAWMGMTQVVYGDWEYTPWEDVGLIAVDDYTLLYITSSPMTETAFLTLMLRNWLVRSDMVETEGYNRTENTASFGPYRMVSISEYEIVLEQNPYWFGWADGGMAYENRHRAIFSNITMEYDYERVVLALTPAAPPAEDDDEPVAIVLGEPGERGPFPFPFEAVDIFGNTVTEADLGEKEIFLVYFWTTWCPNCVASMPMLSEAMALHGDNVGFITLLAAQCFELNPRGAQRLLEYHDFPAIHVIDNLEALIEPRDMVRTGFVPTTAIIDFNGNMVFEDPQVGNPAGGYIHFIERALHDVRSR